MRDGLGRPQRIAVVGASSDIAAACLNALVAAGGVRSAVLTARDPAALDVEPLRAIGVAIETLAWDALGADGDGAALVDRLWAGGDVDLLLIGVGVLPQQAAIEADPGTLPGLIGANFTAPATVGLRAAAKMREQGHGQIVVLSSVAAERPRADNYAYASTKAGLDAFFVGLGDALRAEGIDVLTVRPGFVHSKMTLGEEPAPLATTPEKVAADVAAAVAAGGSRILWSPAPVRVLMSVLRHLPGPIFRKVAESRG